jgi:hypothetical protein
MEWGYECWAVRAVLYGMVRGMKAVLYMVRGMRAGLYIWNGKEYEGWAVYMEW